MLGAQCFNKLPHTLGLAGQDQVRRKFRERRKNEAAEMGAGMRKRQLRRCADERSESDEVKVERPRFIELSFWQAAKGAFHCLQLG